MYGNRFKNIDLNYSQTLWFSFVVVLQLLKIFVISSSSIKVKGLLSPTLKGLQNIIYINVTHSTLSTSGNFVSNPIYLVNK